MDPTSTVRPPATPEELMRLRLAVEASGEVIFMTDAAGVITYVNPEFVRLYGYQPSEVLGKTTPRVLKGGSTTPEEYSAFWGDLLARRVVKREFVNRTKSGAFVEIEGSANPIFTDGDLVGFLAVQRDVTQRKATEAALRESESRYRALAEAAHDSIFIVNSDMRIEYANAVSFERFGLVPEQAIGRPVREVFAPAAAEEMLRELSIVFDTHQRHYFEARFNSPAGDLWLGTWLIPMSRETSETSAVMGVARDITDRKRLERDFAQAQKMEAVGRLAGGIAHDFNNLLTAILGYSDLLLDRVRDDDDLAADLYEIKKAGERASRLTRQLLTFSRKETYSPKILDLNDVVGELEKMLNRIIGEDILLDIVKAPAVAPVVADPNQLEQLVLNLVVNSRDAMPQGGTLRIGTFNAQLDAEFVRHHDGARVGSYVALAVQDTGSGMPEDVQSHVFEPFFTTKPAGKGTGLGLSTVYGIVKQSEGYITIDSQVGAGTTITSYFPAAPKETRVEANVPDRSNTLAGTETILLVEDDAGLRRLMQRSLGRCGYTVLSAQDVSDALSLSEKHAGTIDLLLSDVVMPGLSGPALAQRVVRSRPAIKVLYVSGFSRHPAVDGESVSPRTAFLAKPFTPQALQTIVRRVLDSPAPETT